MNNAEIKNRLIKHTRSELSNIDASLILMSAVASKSMRNNLYKQIRGIDNEWIEKASMEEMSLRLLGIKIYKPNDLDGELVARLVRRLVSSEVKVGGPYSDNSSPEFFTNAIIAQLLTSLNLKMPNLITYLQAEQISIFDQFSLKDYWAIQWPNKLIDASTTRPPLSNSISDMVATICLEKLSAKKYIKTSNIVQKQVKRSLSTLSLELQKTSGDVYDLLCIADRDGEISLLSRYFVESLKINHTLKPRTITKLGVANFYAWMAYSIYDDFIDDEGVPRLLPFANVMHRNSLIEYLETVTKQDKSFVENVYNLVDTANAWEISNCRFPVTSINIKILEIPDYKNGQVLADRAFGHVLGPVLIANTLKLSQKQKNDLELGLRFYLISRQLNDDLHDWKEDIRNGHISYILAFLLNKAKIKQGTYEISKLITKLEIYFWEQGFELVNKEIHGYLKESFNAFEACGVVSLDGIFLKHTLGPLKKSVIESKQMIKNQKEFLEFYSK